jgi:hypothetical protein
MLAEAGRMNQTELVEHANRIPGFRRSVLATSTIDLSLFLDPLRWTRWRREIHRLGPYAPHYTGRRLIVHQRALNWSFATLLFAAAATLIVTLSR